MSNISLKEPPQAKRTLNLTRFKRDLVGWCFILAPVILIGIFVVYPMINSFHLSLQSGVGRNLNFVGLDNYTRLFQDRTFIRALQNNLTYLAIQVPLMILLGLLYAVLLNKKDLKFRSFFRMCIFLPAITSLMAYATVFRYLFDQQGIINALLLNWGLIQDPIGWLMNPVLARVTIIAALTWRWTGYNMIFYLSSLQNIDEGIYEAAKIDGANAVQAFFKITIPLLKPIILFTSIMSTIGTLQLFDEVVQITDGGPGQATVTMTQYIFNLMFWYNPDFGYAATVSFAVLLMILTLSVIQFWATRDRDKPRRRA
ncbi:MAG: sugar ABC transporter permease [Defluviitaleaceae bacterium]|nr:sugar ABC transporter permease [Defluviitaleaceae bacterium]